MNDEQRDDFKNQVKQAVQYLELDERALPILLNDPDQLFLTDDANYLVKMAFAAV